MLETKLKKVAPDCRIRYAPFGQNNGTSPLIFLHGYPENLQIWSRLIPLLAEQEHGMALDWPGLGASDAWLNGYTPRHMADRLKALMDAFDIPKASLVAMDMGAQPALVFASKYPDNIDCLIVMNSLALGDESTSWEIRLLRKMGLNIKVLRHLPRIVFARAERTFLSPGTKLDKALRAEFWDCFRRPVVRECLVRMCAGYQAALPRLPDDYQAISCPTLILWGARDKHFPPIQGQRLQELVSGSTLQVIEQGQHWMMWQHAQLLGAPILQFLRAHKDTTFLREIS
jgi:pimeloyl-ACP methyl ester carboxylesterase